MNSQTEKLERTHYSDQVSTHTGHNQLPIFCCTNVHPGRYTHLLIDDAMSQNKLTARLLMSARQKWFYIKKSKAKCKRQIWDFLVLTSKKYSHLQPI